jgi:hypothetical protein
MACGTDILRRIPFITLSNWSDPLKELQIGHPQEFDVHTESSSASEITDNLGLCLVKAYPQLIAYIQTTQKISTLLTDPGPQLFAADFPIDPHLETLFKNNRYTELNHSLLESLGVSIINYLQSGTSCIDQVRAFFLAKNTNDVAQKLFKEELHTFYSLFYTACKEECDNPSTSLARREFLVQWITLFVNDAYKLTTEQPSIDPRFYTLRQALMNIGSCSSEEKYVEKEPTNGVKKSRFGSD